VTHRHSAPGQHEHEFEPVRGLPEHLPAGEQLLWQGSPDWRTLARQAFHLRKLAVYFGVLVALRVAVLASQQATPWDMLVAALWIGLLGTTAIGLLGLMAWLSARAAVYTITDRRVVMRIGIVLTLTFNIPFKRIEAAGLHVEGNGCGDIPLSLAGEDRIAYLHLWPHARAWRLARPEPMLRCVPRATAVARLLAQAWSQQTGVALTAEAAIAPERAGSPQGRPALAGR
jgi:hypothetical protein